MRRSRLEQPATRGARDLVNVGIRDLAKRGSGGLAGPRTDEPPNCGIGIHASQSDGAVVWSSVPGVLAAANPASGGASEATGHAGRRRRTSPPAPGLAFSLYSGHEV